MNEIYVVLAIFVNLFSKTVSNDVLGCGGFVKSHVPIDYSRVEVKLLTKTGILKDKINCAPNNGYYFVPLYDKGEYVLELQPPAGWSFSPTKVDLVIDGVSDLCALGQDINFVFKGFGITGKVESLGLTTGPKGVEIELKSSSQVRKALTSVGGSFFFTPVYPGNYEVRISNSKWKIHKESVNVVVAEGNTELPSKSLIIHGYDVSGSVKTESEPIKDTTLVLFAPGLKEVNVDGCDKTSLPNVQSKDKPLCHVKSDENGIFKFGSIPSGKYYVQPFFNDQNIYYQPRSINFEVAHDSVQLEGHFEIIGFTVTGRVLTTHNGKGIPNAKIYLNGNEITTTNTDGVYKIDKLKTSTYKLKVVTERFQFDEKTLKISPNSKQIDDLIPSAYHICGNVLSDKSQSVTFSQVGSTKIVTTKSTAGNGEFCEYLTPGKYQVEVVVDSSDVQKGLQFFPNVHTIEVNSDHVSSIVFSQLKARISGKVLCLQASDCVGLKLTLTPNGRDISNSNNLIIDLKDNFYEVNDIYPGIYEISLAENKLCWREQKHTINVNSVNVAVPSFEQKGYSVIFKSSHDTQVSYTVPGLSSEHSIKVNKGQTDYCLDKSGSYSFQMLSCHSYESNSIAYIVNTKNNEITLNALKHTLTLSIESEKKQGDVSVSININGVKTATPALPYKNHAYELNLLLSPDESAVIVPQSDILYFNPPILSVTGGNDCSNLGPKMKALAGVVLKGKIVPPLSGVLITVETENSDSLIAETDQKGEYSFPPLDQSKVYKITAQKESFIFVGPSDQGDFLAHKLAEIVIEVFDQLDKTPLQGTLLSLSGGDSYRSNLQTNEDGKIAFHSLSPGDYFLRPMMKEYSFEPNSKIIKVEEGQTVTVQLMGRRVAYSAYGQITSLNREPEDNIAVVALGLGNCSHFSEESTSENNGQFRIRGLQPYCSYDISVKANKNEQPDIERGAPKAQRIENVSADIHSLQLIVFRPATTLDLLVKVYAKNAEYYKSLRLKVVRGIHSSNVIYSTKLDTSSLAITNDQNYGVLVQVTPIPLDGKTYVVLLESNLNNNYEPEPIIFVANSSFKHIQMDFLVKSNVTEQDIKQTSMWTLVFIFGAMFAVYNIDKVSQLAKDKFGGYVADVVNSTTKKAVVTEHVVDNNDIDQIVQSINAVKRKPKPKKI